VGSPADHAVGHIGPRHLQRHDHVLESVQAGQQTVVLEDEPGIAAQPFDAAQEAPVQRVTVHPQAAPVRPELPVDEAQQGALAGARIPRHRHQLTQRGREGQLVQHHPLPEHLADLGDLEQRALQSYRFYPAGGALADRRAPLSGSLPNLVSYQQPHRPRRRPT